MGKYSSKDTYFKRLQELADVKKPLLKESTRTIGNLVDYKRAANGVAYGIIKENHHYYVKKGGIKENPDASDFTYIGGLGNVTDYQYTKLSEADKNRNMILNTINESYSQKLSKDGSIGKLNKSTKKNMLSENFDENAGEDIEQAEDKLDDLEAASQKAAASEPEDASEPAPDVDIDVAPVDDEPAPENGEESPDVDIDVAPEGGEKPAPENGDEPAPEGGEDMPDLDGLGLDDEPAPENGEESPDVDIDVAPEGGDEKSAESGDNAALDNYEKFVGKLQQSLRELPNISKDKLEDTLKQVLSAYKDKIVDTEMSIEDRKEIAKDYIINVEDTNAEEEIPDMSGEEDDEEKVVQMPTDDEEGEEELPMAAEGKNSCDECGSFVQYAESRGYTSESIVEATDDEIANLTAGYVGAHKDGMNEGDFESVGTHLTNESFNKLKEEYGFDDEELADYEQSLNEMDGDQRIEKINELWGGLKNLGKQAGQGIAKGAQAAGKAVGDAAGKAWDTTKDVAGKAGQAVGDAAQQAGDWVSKTYHQGEVGQEVKKIEKMANDLGNQLVGLNSRLEKAGQQPINPNSLLRGLANQILAGKQVDVSRTKAGAGIQREGMNDPASVETQPTPTFAAEAQVLGVGINESELKVRKYVRTRLQEMMGIKKSKINENNKSAGIKKLDKIIERQFKLYENVVKKKLK
ncbi:MAG: hypothetical protein ACOC22_00310 [bacterium]